MNHLKGSLSKIMKTFGLQQELLKKEMDHEEKYEHTWADVRHEWIPQIRKKRCITFNFRLCNINNECFENHWIWNERLFISPLPRLGNFKFIEIVR